MPHWYVKVPAFTNLWLKDFPGARSFESNDSPPPVDATVCVFESSLVQRSVVPTFTFSSLGVNAKSLRSTVEPVAAGAALVAAEPGFLVVLVELWLDLLQPTAPRNRRAATADVVNARVLFMLGLR